MKRVFLIITAVLSLAAFAGLTGRAALASGSCTGEFADAPTASSGSLGFASTTSMSCTPSSWHYTIQPEYKDGGVWHTLNNGNGNPILFSMPGASCGPGSHYTASTALHMTLNDNGVTCGVGEGNGYLRKGGIGQWHKSDGSTPISDLTNFDLRLHIVVTNDVDLNEIENYNTGVRPHD